MHKNVKNLIEIVNKVKLKVKKTEKTNHPTIIAVSKTFELENIVPLIEHGHDHFGENKVQEAIDKWSNIKNLNKNLKLHMIGKLQTNKVKYVIPLFDYIHSLDNLKLANLLSKYETLFNKKRKYFIQVNVANEKQKSGIDKNKLALFYKYCTEELNLKIIGLMCIPPNDGSANVYFKSTMELNESLGLKELSIGMSADFLTAIKYNSTFIRIGSAIFGERS